MPQQFTISGNIEFTGDELLEGRVEAYDSPPRIDL
jgi:hypothetical protein